MLLYSVVLLWFLAHNDSALGKPNIFTSIINATENAAKKIFDEITHPEKLFEDTVKAIVGLAEEVAFTLVDKFCPLLSHSPEAPDMDSMYIILRMPCQYKVTYALDYTDMILDSYFFDVKKKVVIFITGWKSRPDDDYVETMVNAFNCRGDSNFLVLSTANYARILYTWSAYNTEGIGDQVAKALTGLLQKVRPQDIHLIGHSLGAHIAGYVGHFFKKYTGFNIGRITGLDPAHPCFEKNENLGGLIRGDADFVDVIHTNPNIMGKKDPLGDVDFYPEGFDEIKPGCLLVPCSHIRAIDYFAESVYPGNERNFLASPCSSLSNLEKGNCFGKTIPMGIATPNNSRGNYFLKVNSDKPYGKNYKARNAVPSTCGKC